MYRKPRKDFGGICRKLREQDNCYVQGRTSLGADYGLILFSRAVMEGFLSEGIISADS